MIRLRLLWRCYLRWRRVGLLAIEAAPPAPAGAPADAEPWRGIIARF